MADPKVRRGTPAEVPAEERPRTGTRQPAEPVEAETPRVDEVDEASIESFPASDPPSWSPTTTGPPDRHEGTGAAAARPYAVIYDGDCRTCTKLAGVLERWDRQEQLWVVPSSDARVADLFPWIPASAYEQALQMVGPDRTTVEGAAAIQELLDILPGGTPLARLFSIPVLGRVLDRGYRWFARNRRSFGCGDHCSIPLDRTGMP